MRRATRTMRVGAGALVLAFVASACSGPRSELEVGSKEIAVDIALGRQHQPPAPPTGVTPNPGFPGFIQPPIPRPDPGVPPPPPPPQPSCPVADPTAPLRLAARLTADHMPVEATYVYRNAGELSVGTLKTPYPETMKRTVQNVAPLGNTTSFEFEVASDLAGVVTTTRYRALNSGSTPDRGLYIVQVVTRRPTGTESFTPDRPILLMPFISPEYGTNLEDELDTVRNEGYTSQGTDPLTQTTMTLEARVDGKRRVNACGEWVDAFDIVVTRGRIVGPTKQIEFTGNYLVAPQYGALIVEDDISMSGTEVGTGGQTRVEQVESKLRSIITRLPVAPPGAES